MNAVDTNVLIYASDSRQPDKQAVALQLIESLENGIVLWQVACEFIAASRRLEALGFDAGGAWSKLASLLEAYPLAIPTPGVLTRARELHLQRRVAFWDAMLYAACVEAGVNTLFSEDIPGQAIYGLTITNPFGSATQR